MEKKFIVRRLVACSVTALLLLGSASQVGAATLERIKSTGFTTVCADPNNLPISDSKLSPPGYDLEVAAEIAKSLGAKLKYNWFATEFMGKVLRELYEERCDFVVGIPTDKRLDGAGPRLALSQPYLVSGFALVIGKGRPENRLEELKAQRIGVGLHTVSDFVAFDLGYERVLFAKQQDVFEAVVRGEVPAGLVSAPLAGWLSKQNPATQVRVSKETRPELTFSLAVGVSKDDPAFLDAINDAISALIRSGKRDDILAKYGVPKLNSSAVAAGMRPVSSNPNWANSSMDRRETSLTRTVWRTSQQAARGNMGEGRFIRTVGGAAKASAWPPEDEQTSQSPQGASEPTKKQDSVEHSAGKGESGYNLYHRACGKCHGRNVISGGIFPDLRRFEGSDSDFLVTVKKGRSGTPMPAWEKVMSDEEIERIRTYVKSVPQE